MPYSPVVTSSCSFRMAISNVKFWPNSRKQPVRILAPSSERNKAIMDVSVSRTWLPLPPKSMYLRIVSDIGSEGNAVAIITADSAKAAIHRQNL